MTARTYPQLTELAPMLEAISQTSQQNETTSKV